MQCLVKFLSTLSLRRATVYNARTDTIVMISIHALLAESDHRSGSAQSPVGHFYPRSPCGERRAARRCEHGQRRISIHALLAESDNRGWIRFWSSDKFLSTLSLRRATAGHHRRLQTVFISIHALLAESDHAAEQVEGMTMISIHALLAESDHPPRQNAPSASAYFYPRSPCGERRTFMLIPSMR